ncbi:MAG TPA: hypothetical protein VFD92_07015 [Candidatus Binatia bacterium]|nr:hypothetical protein [Candidatus Binatia bacterium]
MDPTTIMTTAAITGGSLGVVLNPTVLFAVWSGLVIAVLGGLCAVLGVEGPADVFDVPGRPSRLRPLRPVASRNDREPVAA